MSEKIFNYLKTCTDSDGPIVVCDTDIVLHNFTQMRQLLPICADTIYYAMKANPHPDILRTLAAAGSCFDCASKGEIELLVSSTGINYDRISFGNTIKKERDIAWAYEKGIRCYAFDSESELKKLAQQAPGSKVFCRILSECSGAEWPLSKKFGCVPAMAVDLLKMASTMGLDAYGVSFHVGSQQTDVSTCLVCLFAPKLRLYYFHVCHSRLQVFQL